MTFMCILMWCRGKNTVLSMWYSWQKCLTWLLTRKEREINLDCGTFFLRLVLFKNVCVMVAKTEWPWSVLDYRRLKGHNEQISRWSWMDPGLGVGGGRELSGTLRTNWRNLIRHNIILVSYFLGCVLWVSRRMSSFPRYSCI